MESIKIMAVIEEGGQQVGCGSRECATALEAVMRELAEKPADTAGAHEVSASDEWMTVSAYRCDTGGYEVHLYVGDDDLWFAAEIA